MYVETTCMNKVKRPKINEQKQLQSPKQSTRQKYFLIRITKRISINNVHTKESQHILWRTTHNLKAKSQRVENKRSFKEQRTTWSFKEHRAKKWRWRRCLLCYEEMERRGKGRKSNRKQHCMHDFSQYFCNDDATYNLGPCVNANGNRVVSRHHCNLQIV